MSHAMTCQGILGRLFGHKYRPRYDVKERENQKSPTGADLFWSSSVDVEFNLKLFVLTDTTYVCDVCVRCGDQRKREDKCQQS